MAALPYAASQRFDVLIVGGGLVGALSAIRLRQAGVHVAVVESGGQILQGASRMAAGILGAQAEAHAVPAAFDFSLRARAGYEDFVREIESATECLVDYQVNGLLKPALSAAESAPLQAEVKAHLARGLSAEWLAQSYSDFPHGCAYFPNDAQVDTQRLAAAALAWLQRLEIPVLSDHAIQYIEVQPDHALIHTANTALYAHQVVVTAGAWSGQLECVWQGQRLTLGEEITPVKGVLLHVVAPDYAVRAIVYHPRLYIIRRLGDLVVIGATTERCGFDARIELSHQQQLLDSLTLCMPSLLKAKALHYAAGLRPYSQRNIPLIGHAQVEGTPLAALLVAAGHYRNGILQAPLTAEVISRIITHQPVGFDVTPFTPHLFPVLTSRSKQ